jgi:hypothetical protein
MWSSSTDEGTPPSINNNCSVLSHSSNSSDDEEEEDSKHNSSLIQQEEENDHNNPYDPAQTHINNEEYNNNNINIGVPLISLSLPPVVDKLSIFSLYSTKLKYYIIATYPQMKAANQNKLINIYRSTVLELHIDYDNSLYDLESINSILSMTSAVKLANAYGIIGFPRFIGGYYLHIITSISSVGVIGSHYIYTINETQLISIPALHALEASKINQKLEAKYKQLFLMVDCTKNFYFSYTYPLSQTLQYNMIHSEAYRCNYQSLYNDERSMYIWNTNQLAPFKQCIGENYRDWSVSLIHGYLEQCSLSIFGRVVQLTLISRRSSIYAGTRYLKRGINEQGYTANEVETEQLLYDCSASKQFTSHVQMRGSIPVHWSQEGNVVVAQPAITLQKVDPLHLSTRNHITNLFQRYGSPVLMLNLVKQSEGRKRESIVGAAFTEAIAFINGWLPAEYQVDYLAWDFKKISKSKTMSVVDELAVIAHWALQKTGLFSSNPNHKAIRSCQHPLDIKPTRESLKHFVPNLPQRSTAALDKSQQFNQAAQIALNALNEANSSNNTPRARDISLNSKESSASVSPPAYLRDVCYIQRGICRSNCIDSLDRTNVAAFCIGRCSLGYQLFSMGLIECQQTDSNSEIVNILLEMYERMGDVLALQYGGSHMHRQMKKDQTKTVSLAPVLFTKQSQPNKPKEMLVSLMRHYQNSFQDNGKQDAINLFLGLFKPQAELHIWDLVNDYYLHNPSLCCSDGLMIQPSYCSPHWYTQPINQFEASLLQFARTSNTSTLNSSASTAQDDASQARLEEDRDLLFELNYGRSSELSSFDELLSQPVRSIRLSGLKEEKKSSFGARLRAGLKLRRNPTEINAEPDEGGNEEEDKWMEALHFGRNLSHKPPPTAAAAGERLALPDFISLSSSSSSSSSASLECSEVEKFYCSSLEQSLEKNLIPPQVQHCQATNHSSLYNLYSHYFQENYLNDTLLQHNFDSHDKAEDLPSIELLAVKEIYEQYNNIAAMQS